MARFFIDRPIFAWVIAILMMLAGALTLTSLPIERYPSIAPPTVSISATYPGASAKTVEDSVTQIIEQQMKGLDGLIYMSSNSSSSGTAQVTLISKHQLGCDIDVSTKQARRKKTNLGLTCDVRRSIDNNLGPVLRPCKYISLVPDLHG